MEKDKELSASLEDYLEAIYLICMENGEARSKNIMDRLGVTGPSVTEALQLLSEKELVNYAPYESISLTSKGEVAARDVLFRHETLRDFFINVLGVDAHTADEGACKMEHVASPLIIKRMVQYSKYLREERRGASSENEDGFEDYLRKQGQ